jgi:hypothetical protein
MSPQLESLSGPDGRMRSAGRTFERKVDAQRFLTMVEPAMQRGEWTDLALAKVRLAEYACCASRRPSPAAPSIAQTRSVHDAAHARRFSTCAAEARTRICPSRVSTTHAVRPPSSLIRRFLIV